MRAGIRVLGASLLSFAVFHAAAPALALELTDKVETWLTASEAEKKELTMNYARSFPESRGKGKGAVEIVAMVPEACLNQYVGPKSNLPKAPQQAMLSMTYREVFPVCFAAMKKGFEAEFGK